MSLAAGRRRAAPAVGRRVVAGGHRLALGLGRRLLALAAGMLLAAALVPATASAHGGILLGSAIAGPYRTQVTAAPLVQRGQPPAIDVTVYLSSTTSSAPISDATVRTTVKADGRTVRPRVNQIAGGYEAIVPVKNAYTVGQQTIDVDITGPEGTGHVTVRPFKKDGGPPVGLMIGTGIVVLGLVVLTVRVRRRRAAEGEDGEDVWPDQAAA